MGLSQDGKVAFEGQLVATRPGRPPPVAIEGGFSTRNEDGSDRTDPPNTIVAILLAVEPAAGSVA